LALLGLIWPLAESLRLAIKPSYRRLALAAVAICLSVLALAARQQAASWLSSLTVWENNHRRYPASAKAGWELSRLYRSAGQIEQAEAVARNYLNDYNRYAEYNFLSGLSELEDSHDYAKALGYFQKSIDRQPDVAAYHFRAAQAESALHQDKAAEASLNRAEELAAGHWPKIYSKQIREQRRLLQAE